jgi:hypothetical protein
MTLSLQVKSLFGEILLLKLLAVETVQNLSVPMLTSLRILIDGSYKVLTSRLTDSVEWVVLFQCALEFYFDLVDVQFNPVFLELPLYLLPLVLQTWSTVQPDLSITKLLIQQYLRPEGVNKSFALTVTGSFLRNLTCHRY